MTLVTYELDGQVATITMDDGKVNALSLDMLGELHTAFDRAARDNAVAVLTGRSGILSAGFDLKVIRTTGPDAVTMLRRGFELAEKLLSFPTPVVIACPGHAIAMASFLLLSGDYRLGADGNFKITANEVAIGMTLPYAAIEICRGRLTPSQLNRALITAEVFPPDAAVAAGYLDRVVAVDDLLDAAKTLA